MTFLYRYGSNANTPDNNGYVWVDTVAQILYINQYSSDGKNVDYVLNATLPEKSKVFVNTTSGSVLTCLTSSPITINGSLKVTIPCSLVVTDGIPSTGNSITVVITEAPLLDEISNVEYTPPIINGQVLGYNGNIWTNVTPSGGGGGGAPTIDTYITMLNHTVDLPNSINLAQFSNNALVGNNLTSTSLEKKGSIDMGGTTGNVLLGQDAGKVISTSYGTVGIGRNALENIVSGINTTAIGDWAGRNSTGDNNEFLGNSSGSAITSGNFNLIAGSGILETKLSRPTLTDSTNNVVIHNSDITNGNTTSINNSVICGVATMLPQSVNNECSFGINNEQRANTNLTLGIGNITDSYGGIAVGISNIATGTTSVALGYGSNALSENSLAIGYGAIANAIGATVIGSHQPLNNITEGSMVLSASRVGIDCADALYALDLASGIVDLRAANSNCITIGIGNSVDDPTPLPLPTGHNVLYCASGKPKWCYASTPSFIQLSPTDTSQVIQIANPIITPTTNAGEIAMYNGNSNQFENIPSTSSYSNMIYLFDGTAGGLPPAGVCSCVTVGPTNTWYFNVVNNQGIDMTSIWINMSAHKYKLCSFPDTICIDFLSEALFSGSIVHFTSSTNTTTFSNKLYNFTAVGNTFFKSNDSILITNDTNSNLTTGINNTAVGIDTFQNDTTGSGNVAMGVQVLQNNTTGEYNNGIGFQALKSNTTGGYNDGIGFQALKANTTGSWNNAVGDYALTSNISGNNNTAFGSSALQNNTTTSNNTAIGLYTLTNLVGGLGNNTAIGSKSQVYAVGGSGYNNTSIGAESMRYNLSGINNIAVGNDALKNNSTSSNNVAIGVSSLSNNTTGTEHLAVGGQAMVFNTTGTFNTAVGYFSLTSNTSGSNNTAVGHYSGKGLNSGSNNIAIGHDTNFGVGNASNRILIGTGGAASGTTLHDNSLVVTGSTDITGFFFPKLATATTSNTLYFDSANGKITYGASGTAPTTFSDGTFKVYNAVDPSKQFALDVSGVASLTTRTFVVPNGNGILPFMPNASSLMTGVTTSAMTGIENTSYGFVALASCTTGAVNTAIGRYALNANTNGSSNTAFGNGALSDNTSGSSNTGVGTFALRSNTIGVTNMGIGWSSLSQNTTGNDNLGIGTLSGQTSKTGSNNVFIGSGADTTNDNISNAIAIGKFAKVSNNGDFALGSATNPLNTSVSASAGTASLPIAPALFLSIKLNGTYYKMPLYLP